MRYRKYKKGINKLNLLIIIFFFLIIIVTLYIKITKNDTTQQTSKQNTFTTTMTGPPKVSSYSGEIQTTEWKKYTSSNLGLSILYPLEGPGVIRADFVSILKNCSKIRKSIFQKKTQ